MISDKERREVAAMLRGLDEYIDGVPPMCSPQVHNAMALSAIRAVVGKGDIFHLIADLIDRPTCKNADSHYDVFECSACRCKVEFTAEACDELGNTVHVFFVPSYCPSCGAEVVE